MGADEKKIFRLIKEIEQLEWRLKAVEKEQRLIRDDILSGEPVERIKKRILVNPSDKLDKEIKIRV